MKTKELVDTNTGEILQVPVQDVQEARDERKRKNRDFVMLYRRFVSQIADLGLRDVQALRILLFLIRHMDPKNALAVPMSLIADMVGLSRQTVSAKLKYLRDNGWIQIYRLGKQNVYTINPSVAWTAYDDDKQYCKFTATVMLSSVDNWEMRGDSKVTLRHLDRQVLKELAEREFPEESPEEPSKGRQMDITDFPEAMP